VFDSDSFSTDAFSTSSWLFGSLVASGGVTLSGSATFSYNRTIEPSGGVSISGTAALNFQSILGGNGRQRPLVGVGQ
jgi:hypothetical protein